MPIYAYKCESCGFAKDVLQKISDAPLSECPTCGAATFTKQLTAAGFQLKGSGWYVTDFKGGGAAPAANKDGDKKEGDNKEGDKPAGDKAAAPTSAPATSDTTAAATPASPSVSASTTPAAIAS